MPKPWLKSWSSSLDNPKIQLLTGDQFKAWHNLLWIALRHDREGELPPMQLVAFQLRIGLREAEDIVQEQVRLGLVENGGSRYLVHDWKHWQGETMDGGSVALEDPGEGRRASGIGQSG